MKIVTSNTSHDAYFRVLGEMKKRAGQPIVVIAPDRFTASVERGLIATLGIESSFNIEVMSFTRLANRYLKGSIDKCLTPEGSVMLIAKVIDDCNKKGMLTYYGAAANKEGFASELYAALTAIRNSGVSTVRLEEASGRAKQAALRRKLADILTIYKGYLAALDEGHSDSTTRLEVFAEYIDKHKDEFSSTHYFCTDINEFSVPEYDILAGLARAAGSLTVGIESGAGNPNARIYPDRVIQKLISLVPDKVQVESYEDPALTGAVAMMSKRLFSYQPPEVPAQNDGFLTLRVAKDRADEVLRLALDVLKHVRQGGRYRDFEVYASDLGAYERDVKNIFARYDIPFFIDRRAPLAEQTKVRYLLEAIAVVRSGFDLREVLDFVKNPLFAYYLEDGEEDVFKFENYLLEKNIKSRMLFETFLSGNDITTQKQDFKYVKREDKTSEELKECAERVRAKLIDTLKPFTDIAGDGVVCVAMFTEAARKLLDAAKEASVAHTKRLGELSAYYVKCADQVDNKLKSVLDEIDDALDGDSDILGFEGVIKGMLKTLKISLVPTYLDCVFVGDSDSRFMGDGRIYVLGATNDALPKSGGGGAVLGVRDEDALSALGVPIVPSVRQKAYAEMFAVLDLFKKPRGGLTISYPETGGGDMLRASTVVDELKTMIADGDSPLKEERIDFSRLSALDEDTLSLLFSTQKSAAHFVISDFGRVGADAGMELGSAYECMAGEDRAKINVHGDMPSRIVLPSSRRFGAFTSVSRLETFFACPYKHYFQYILALRRRKEGEMEGNENGLILHSVLERFFKAVRDGEIESERDIRAAAESYFDMAILEGGYEVLLTKPQPSRILMRVREEGVQVCKKLYDISLRSAFKPKLLEARTEELTDIALTADGEEIKLKGIIDRVDVLDDKFIVIDYKTYKSSSLDLGIDDVYFGRKLQLFIYMRAVEKALGLEPAGVFYLPITSRFEKEDTPRFLYRGYASRDAETLRFMDGEIGEADSIVPLYVDRKGELDLERHLDREGFDAFGDYAEALAAHGASEIAKGFIKPSPAKACSPISCDYFELCPYKSEDIVRSGHAPDIEGLKEACVGCAPDGSGDSAKEEK